MPTLTIIRGASGSGKTTLAKVLSEVNDCPYFEADMYFINESGEYQFDFTKLKNAHAWCQGIVKSYMKDGVDVIVSNTFTKIWEMKPYLNMANEFGYDVQVIHCQGKFDNVHGVPEDKVQQMRDNFEPYKL